uniref:Uncharacterized protein n=1 Tax=Glycine max TaxID=3847 RepID=A0A0R0JCW9_SOYBN
MPNTTQPSKSNTKHLNTFFPRLRKDTFTRCFKSNPPEPWNCNVYLFHLWCCGVVVQYLILFPIRILVLPLGWIIFLSAFIPVHSLLKGNDDVRKTIEVKSIPFSGTGKHKYIFQNIKVPPLPVHFCDCEEHCKPFVLEREKLSIDRVSNAKNLGEEKDSFESPDALHSDECKDSATDEDDLIISVETKKNKTALTEDKELQRILEN